MKRIQLPAVRLAAIVATGLAVSLSGCGVTSPSTITTPYPASDGADGQIGNTGVLLRNMLVIGTAVGQPASIIGSVVNDGTAPVEVMISADPQADGIAAPVQAKVMVPAKSAVRVGPGPGQVPATIPELSAAPGGLVKISAATSSGGKALLSAPVLPPEGVYAGITPAPTPTAIPSTGASASPSPTTTP